MRRSVASFCALQLVIAASAAQAQELIDPPDLLASTDQALPSGYALVVAAGIGTSNELLGRGFNKDLSPARTEVPAEPRAFKELPTRQYDLRFEVIKNSIQLGAHANYLFARAGVQNKQDRRYAVLRASFIDKVVVLDGDAARAVDSDLYAAKIYYGWSLYVVIEGNESSFTADVAAKLAGLGMDAGSKATEYHLQTHVHLIGLETKNPGEIALPTRAEDIPKMFKASATPVPIFVEYVTRRPLVATALPWSSSAIESGHKYRVEVLVEVLPSKANGLGWDGGGGPPDPLVTLYLDGQRGKGCKQQDSLINTCLSGLILDVGEATAIGLSVIDVDFAEDDPIGTAGPVVLAGKAKLYEPLDLPATGQIKRARVTFFPAP